jgi:mRNA interferase MazF
MRGEVWWSERPDAKRRPVVVLTRSVVALRLPQVTIAEVTTSRRGLPTEVELDEDDGLPRACVVTLDNLQTLRRAHLIDYITTLSDERMAEVCQALRIAVDC